MKSEKGSVVERPTFVLLFSGVGCFLLAFVAMGLAPWSTLSSVTQVVQGPGNPYYDTEGKPTAIGRGRKTYIREGCWHCHSQFVRPVAGEPFRYGPASQAWETIYDIPQTYGTRRIGPDLSREAGRHSDDWHLAHLANPRSVAPLSIMPAYSWFYESGPDGLLPKQEARDLVAYLQYLGSSYAKEIEQIVYPAYYKVSGAPQMDQSSFERGSQLFSEQCSGCHGPAADGKGLARAFLKPPAANLVDRYVSPSEIYDILNRGVKGSAMPSFREMPERDLWALALYVSAQGSKTKAAVLRALDKSQVGHGAEIYQARCAVCHGPQGRSDGPAAAALHPRPKDFSRRVFRPDYLSVLVKTGVPGSAMAPQADLSDSDLSALSAYISSLFDESL